MNKRSAIGRGLFYTRDSEGHSELAPQQYVEWARGEASRLGVTFTGTPTAIESMIARGVSAEGDLHIDYGVSGNEMSRPGLDAFRQRALHDTTVASGAIAAGFIRTPKPAAAITTLWMVPRRRESSWDRFSSVSRIPRPWPSSKRDGRNA